MWCDAEWGAVRLSLFGGCAMSQCSVCPEGPDSDGGKQELIRLLAGALNLADSLAMPAEIGARLQEVIDLAGGCLDPEKRPASDC